jgi:hypothetical protein
MIKLHYKLTRLIIIMDPIFLVKLLSLIKSMTGCQVKSPIHIVCIYLSTNPTKTKI